MNDKNSKMQYDSSTLLKLAQSPLAKGRPNNMIVQPGFTITRGVVDGALVAIAQSQDVKVVVKTNFR
jgi:hypothetical protein